MLNVFKVKNYWALIQSKSVFASSWSKGQWQREYKKVLTLKFILEHHGRQKYIMLDSMNDF